MIKRILVLVIGAIIILLLGAWLLSGGPQRAFHSSNKIGNPLDYFFGKGGAGADFKLPWQTSVDLPGDIFKDDASGSASGTDSGTASTPNSIYSESVRLEQGGADSPSASEYVVVSSSASEPVDITGWTLENAATGQRVVIPPTADPYIKGVANPVRDIKLSAGGRAYIYTAASPLGVSFRENKCIGYLSTNRSFTPELPTDCPSASEALPETAENLQHYGESCFAFINTISACELVTKIPANLSSPCIEFLASTYSYNGCVSVHQADEGFASHTWRIYLTIGAELWNNSHDVIRLYDLGGRLVSEITY